jgi:hypothetical protein
MEAQATSAVRLARRGVPRVGPTKVLRTTVMAALHATGQVDGAVSS